MKKQTLASYTLSLVFMIAAIFAATTTARAGNDYANRTTYDVPFDFYVGNAKMSAGKYEIQRISETNYQIRSVANSSSILVMAQTPTGDEMNVKSAKLIFRQYGKNHFLRAIYTQVRANGRLVGESKTERRVRKEAQSEENLASAKPEIVEVKGN